MAEYDNAYNFTKFYSFSIAKALLLMIAGIVIYALLRDHVLFIEFFLKDYTGPLHHIAMSHIHNPIIYFTVFCLADALWYAALIILQYPFRNYGNIANRIMYYFSLSLPFILEILQWTKVIPGTFDIFDIITYIFIYIFTSIYLKHQRNQSEEYKYNTNHINHVQLKQKQ